MVGEDLNALTNVNSSNSVLKELLNTNENNETIFVVKKLKVGLWSKWNFNPSAIV